MAMDSLAGEHQDESVVVYACDDAGTMKGFLHFVPVFGRPAMSLSLMRRDRDATNGLTEFLVVRAVELLRERGVEELSLNFAAFGRVLARPERTRRPRPRETGVARRSLLPDREPLSLQCEVLASLGAAVPRIRTLLGLPRVGLAAMVAEGQLPRLGARR